MRRVTLFLEEEQIEKLKRIARRHGKYHRRSTPWSCMVRRAIDFFCSKVDLTYPEYDGRIGAAQDGRRGRKMPSRKKLAGSGGAATPKQQDSGGE